MTKTKLWFLATRPKTLVASGIPVVLGSALAYHAGVFSFTLALTAFICSILIQIATNFINEIYDFRKGADSFNRVGPVRAVSAGLISEKQMIRASWMVVGVCFVLGLYLVWVRGVIVMSIGIISLALAWAYTGGRFSLAYKGLGDIFVFIFFGLVATGGTYYVIHGDISTSAVILGCIPGAFAMNILGVNNLRDRDSDSIVGKRTFAVRFGATSSRVLYIVMTMVAYLASFLLFLIENSMWILLPFLTSPFGFNLCQKVVINDGESLNTVLVQTGILLAAFGLLISLGLLIASN
ncbi:MAG: 1,4-dihydroxy-2-naphthoate polyprenyltransferase [Bacteroidetes bacterium]|nr:1,4-dihydroxy-2-naphthoate polyprenyltransferase [Bacteroidota bacterium]